MTVSGSERQGCKATEYKMWLGQGEYIVVAKFISFSRWINEYFVLIVSLSINRNHDIVHVTTSVCMYYHHWVDTSAGAL